MDISTTYLGIKLRTPLVVAASPLSQNLDNIKQMEDAGAAAVVFHSLFEEQLGHESVESSAVSQFKSRPATYLGHIAAAKKSVRIPIIGGLNCTSLDWWTSYAFQIQDAGADALELNIYSVPTDAGTTGSDIEKSYVEIVSAVKSRVTIPLAVKLSPYFSNFANMAKQLDEAGADALVLFNRFYQPDIDLGKMEVTPNLMLSVPMDMRLPLRWIAILYGRLRAKLAATSGIHRGSDVIKMLLVGADVTMLCSTLLRHGIQYISSIEKELLAWLEQAGYADLSQIRGTLSQKNSSDPSAFERAQYVRALSTYEPLFLMRGKEDAP
jgi:dihydroorotate dehydrogenase (fumarate)